MPQKKSDEINQTLIDKIINVAYGDAGLIDTVSIYTKALFNNSVKKLLNDYKITARAVDKINREEFPERIVETVRSGLGINKNKDSSTLKFKKSFVFVLSEARYSIIIASFLILAVISFLIFQNPTTDSNYTKAELEMAQKQFNQTMTIVNRVFKSTGKQLNKEILKDHVSKPVNKGFSLINELIIGG
jgi:hypothetical protein